MDAAEARALLAECELHAVLGLELADWEEGRVAFRFAPPPSTRLGAGGAVHGGALASALDTAATFAVISSVGEDCTTIDLRVDYLRPALDDAFTVEGRTTRAGQRLAFADATLSTLAGRLVASGRGVFVRAS
jgi:uncharacterized protein (TIGR00369 family)